MSLLVDTGVFVAVQNERDEHHEAATNALKAALTGEFGALYTNDYVYDEAVTLTRLRTGSHREARTVGDRIAGRGPFPDRIKMLFVSDDRFEQTVRVFDRYDDHDLSFTDASLVALVENSDIDVVLSFDDDFDGLVDRIDPTMIGDG
ncbi:type II toxin-antitoxin system VapC family toxin [Natrinema pallidum]|uniref:PIN domain protein n=2 Tax=Natrinema pallidum TaxID=69527 RepID=L9Z0Q2_9EURY|nr:PIN domain-containing protein [Natrinema pallidum]ELY78758.1 PIN domain protein [Natrinema pallidum DSM 3751]QCW01751.1 type II toxin-antitoxin system VapC family toxin [Natrinema pallidum]